MDLISKYENFSALQFKISAEELSPIWNEVNEIINFNFTIGEKYNNRLAGNIQHEFSLQKTHDYIEKLLQPAISYHVDNFNYVKNIKYLSKDLPISLEHTWVNFQKKHEFNPLHDHQGVFSFVIWLKVPFSFEEEKQTIQSKNSRNPLPGSFAFAYISQKNGIPDILVESIFVDKNYENCGLLFPANLKHMVYPFYTSDEYRISVAGNFTLKV